MPRETLSRRRRSKFTDDDTNEPDDSVTGDPDDGDEDEAPRRGSRRSKTEEKPAGRRRRVHADDDEDEAPAKSRRRNTAAADDEDDEDDKPSRPRRTANKGWDGYEKTKSSTSDFPDEMKITEDEVLFKFIDDGPLDTYREHWIERNGKKSFTCLEDDCPLCDDLGDKPKSKSVFNVIEFDASGEPSVKLLIVGPLLTGQIKDAAKASKTQPINRADLYWEVSKSGKGLKTKYRLLPVKERDVEDDWDIQPLTDEELSALEEKAFDEDVIQMQTKRQLREIVDEQMD